MSPAGEAAPSRTSDIDFNWDAAPEKKAHAAEAPAAATERSSEAQKTDAEDKPAAKQPSQPDAEPKPAETAPSKANGAADAAKAASLEVDVEDDDEESEKTTLYAQPIGEDDDEEDEEPTFVGDKSKVNGAEKSDPNSASTASRPPAGSLKPLPASLLSAPRTPPPPPPPTPAKSVPPPAPRSSSSPSLRSVPPPSVPSHAEVLPVSSTSPIALGRTTMPTFPPTSVGAPRRTGQIALLAVLVGGLLGLVIVLVARPNALALGSGGTGALIVTVSGPGNAPVSKLTVFADDVSRCEASPCRIAELKGGTHFVRVSAPGYEATAARAVSVNAGNEDTLHIQLSRASEPSEEPVKRAAAAAPEPAAPATPHRAELAAVEPPAPTYARAGAKPAVGGAKPAEKPADKAADKAKVLTGGNGKLNINSIPTANVVLDGRPVGRTPVVGLSVSPGAHTIVLIGPDGARRVTSADVAAGATRNIGVKF